MMGLKDPPYHACQELKWDKEMTLGDRKDVETLLVGRQYSVTYQEQKHTTYDDHGYMSREVMETQRRIYFFMWITTNTLVLHRRCYVKRTGDGVQRVRGWAYRTILVSFINRHKSRDREIVHKLTQRREYMAWYHKIGGIIQFLWYQSCRKLKKVKMMV